MRQIITHAHILTMNANGDILPDGSIVIEDGRIKDILADAVTDSQAEMTDARGMLLLPGFINTHTHLPMVLFRGYADDLPLQEWLKDYIFPAEARWVTPDNVRLATRRFVARRHGGLRRAGRPSGPASARLLPGGRG